MSTASPPSRGTQSEQQHTEPTRTMCGAHGLVYDPRTASGCVLCRRAVGETIGAARDAEAPLSMVVLKKVAIGLLVVGAGVATGSLLWRSESRLSVGAATNASDESCRIGCAKASESCMQSCPVKADPERCSSMCLRGFSECDGRCAKEARRGADPSTYLYAIGALPPWSEVLASAADVNDALLDCTSDPVLAHVEIGASEGDARVNVASQEDLQAATLDCVRTALHQVDYPRTEAGGYRFVAQFDPRLDGHALVVFHAERELATNKDKPEEREQATIRVWQLKEDLARHDAHAREELERATAAATAKRAVALAMHQLVARGDSLRVGAPDAPAGPVTAIIEYQVSPRPPVEGRRRYRSPDRFYSGSRSTWREVQTLRDRRRAQERMEQNRLERLEDRNDDSATRARRERECQEYRQRAIARGENPPPCSRYWW